MYVCMYVCIYIYIYIYIYTCNTIDNMICIHMIYYTILYYNLALLHGVDAVAVADVAALASLLGLLQLERRPEGNCNDININGCQY